MNDPVRVLVVAALLSLVASFLVGYILSNSRLKNPEKRQYYLTLAHRNGLFEAFLLFGLVIPIEVFRLPYAWSLAAAWLAVASAILQVGSGVTAWLQGTRDEFAERSLSFYIATANAILITAAVAIILVSVLISPGVGD